MCERAFSGELECACALEKLGKYGGMPDVFPDGNAIMVAEEDAGSISEGFGD